MIWLTWRQHRSQVFILLLLLVIAGAVFVPLGLQIRGAYIDRGIAACLSSDSDICTRAVQQFHGEFVPVGDVLTLLALVFGLVGGPLIAREYEQGTWRLAWTQAVPRTRWLLVKLGLSVAGLVVFIFGLASIVSWYRSPLDSVNNGRWIEGFDLTGLSLTGYVLFAFAVGVLAGQVLRRPVAAVGLAFVAYLVVKLPVSTVLRPRYLTPLTSMAPAGEADPRLGLQDWEVASGLADAAGHRLTKGQTNMIEGLDAEAYTAYLQTHHIQSWTEYHPAERFWTFQMIEFPSWLKLVRTFGRVDGVECAAEVVG